MISCSINSISPCSIKGMVSCSISNMSPCSDWHNDHLAYCSEKHQQLAIWWSHWWLLWHPNISWKPSIWPSYNHVDGLAAMLGSHQSHQCDHRIASCWCSLTCWSIIIAPNITLQHLKSWTLQHNGSLQHQHHGTLQRQRHGTLQHQWHATLQHQQQADMAQLAPEGLLATFRTIYCNKSTFRSSVCALVLQQQVASLIHFALAFAPLETAFLLLIPSLWWPTVERWCRDPIKNCMRHMQDLNTERKLETSKHQACVAWTMLDATHFEQQFWLWYHQKTCQSQSPSRAVWAKYNLPLQSQW